MDRLEVVTRIFCSGVVGSKIPVAMKMDIAIELADDLILKVLETEKKTEVEP